MSITQLQYGFEISKNQSLSQKLYIIVEHLHTETESYFSICSKLIILSSDAELEKNHFIQLSSQNKQLNQTLPGKLYSLGLPISTDIHHMQKFQQGLASQIKLHKSFFIQIQYLSSTLPTIMYSLSFHVHSNAALHSNSANQIVFTWPSQFLYTNCS